jgi:hypothetical protein
MIKGKLIFPLVTGLPIKVKPRSREDKIMFANAIELGRVIIMVSPLAVWPIMTMILSERSRKQG